MTRDALEIPSPFDRNYRDLRYHAAGSEAEVYTAQYVPTGDRVALKVLMPRPGAPASRERREQRFLREASLLRKAGGEHVTRVYEVIEVRLRGQETKAFSMEWLPETFRDLAARHETGLAVEDLSLYLRQAMEGLRSLHRHGVAVRDMRPENLLLSERGELKIADLGMARTDDSAGSLVESSRYMAPEVLDGSVHEPYQDRDPPPEAYFPVDVYGLGVIFYEAAVGAERWESLETLSSVHATVGPGSGLDRNQRWRDWHQNRGLKLPPLREVRREVTERIGTAVDGMVVKDPGSRMSLEQAAEMLGESGRRASAASHAPVQRSRPRFPQRLPKGVYLLAGGAVLIAVSAMLWPQYVTRPFDEAQVATAEAVQPQATRPPSPPLAASLRVETEPAVVEVYLDGVLKGLSPMELGPLEPGRPYEILLRRGGYKEWRQWVRAIPSLPWLRVVLERVVPPARPQERVESAAARPAPAHNLERTVRRQRDGATMILIPGGEFRMGSTEKEYQAAVEQWITEGASREHAEQLFAVEKPDHVVDTDAFYVDKYEIRNAQYREFVRATGHRIPENDEVTHNVWTGSICPPDLEDHPVVNVSWEDARAYCRWTGARLPTEAEWEKAARGTGGQTYPWGSVWQEGRANHGRYDGSAEAWYGDDSDGYETMSPVGAFDGVGGSSPCSSPYGVEGMAGNVWEWVEDCYRQDYYRDSARRNPRGPRCDDRRVFRGGSWYSDPAFLRVAYRSGYVPGTRGSLLGFRCARDSE